MAKIIFGPAGLGPANEAGKNLEMYHKLGLRACEIAFTYGAYIKEWEAKEIRKTAEKLGMHLSIHAPYFINLNSPDKAKVENSKKRILKCLEIGTLLGAEYVVFHAGFYGKDTKEKSYKTIKDNLTQIEKIRKERGFTPKLAPETMGKVNVFGSPDEIARLVKDTGCSACIDFAHILARSGGNYKFKETLDLFKNLSDLHIHFSGIVYGEKGEIKHKKTSEEELEKLIRALPKNKNVVVINESPDMLNDSVAGKNRYEKIMRN